MARTVLTVTDTTAVSVDVTALEQAGAAAGMSLANGAGDVILFIRNAGAGTHTVTIQTPQTIDGLAVAENAIAVLTTEVHIAGPFAPATFNQSDGTIYIDCDASPTEIKFVALRVTRKS